MSGAGRSGQGNDGAGPDQLPPADKHGDNDDHTRRSDDVYAGDTSRTVDRPRNGSRIKKRP